MRPVVPPADMAAIDASADVGVEVLIERAGFALARGAISMLGGTYGRRVLAICGKGNNGADGKVAARILRSRGVRVQVVEPDSAQEAVSTGRSVDLVIDAAFGTGLRGGWAVPDGVVAPVLAADLPSGLDALTGADQGSLVADMTVTFGAVKPGLLLGHGPAKAGRIDVARLGLGVDATRWWEIDDDDLAACSVRRPDLHKWSHAVLAIAGSAAMPGAGELAASAAMRAGAGMVVHGAPGLDASAVRTPREAVGRSLRTDVEWSSLIDDARRFGAALIGPGIGLEAPTVDRAADFIAAWPHPLVIDADALSVVAARPDVVRARTSATVLTPHDGEFRRLTGSPVGTDRCRAVLDLARRYRCIVLLKGPTTVIADPTGSVRFVTSGDDRLATAGSGDVLAGMIAAQMAAASDARSAIDTVGVAAHWHGRSAAATGLDSGVVAGDLLEGMRAALGSRADG